MKLTNSWCSCMSVLLPMYRVFPTLASIIVDTCDFFQLWEWDFPARGSNCLLSVLLLKWNRIKSFGQRSSCKAPTLAQYARSLLKWNGHDCDGSMHYAIGFYCYHVTMFWNLIGTANFQAAEVTVWTRGSCQTVSPTAWERGYRSNPDCKARQSWTTLGMWVNLLCTKSCGTLQGYLL